MVRPVFSAIVAILLSGYAIGCHAGDLVGAGIPHVDSKAREQFEGKYAKASLHKAFVIGPGGSWQWVNGKSTSQEALDAAVKKCSERVKPHSCIPYARDNETVFDPDAWAAVLGPYPTAEESAAAGVGSEYGQRMYDFAFTTPDGTKRKLSDYHGKVVVLHIWGSWCPPCQYEMPSLNAFYEKLKDNPEVAFIPISVKESFAKSKRWADDKGFTLPYVDTGVSGSDIPLADGDDVSFRRISPYIPTTFFLDRNGAVVFKHVNSFRKWEEFMPQIENLIENGARG